MSRTAIDTLPTGRILITHPDPARLGQAPQRVGEALRVGRTDGSGPDLFGRIAAVELDEAGSLYVAESMSNEVRVFDSTGAHLLSFGGRGSGPGEFLTLSGILLARDGTLLISDPGQLRLTRVSGNGALIDTSRSGSSAFATIPWAAKGDPLGRLHDLARAPDAPGTGPMKQMVTRTAQGAHPAAPPTDSLPLPSPEVRSYEYRTGSIHAQAVVPFSPSAHWAPAAPDGLWISSGIDLAVHLVDFGGDTLRSVTIARDRRPVDRAQRDSAADATGLPIDEIPDAHPAIGRLVSDDAGHLWIATRQTAPDESVEWFVLDPEALLVGWIVLDVPLAIGRVNPLVRNGRIVGVAYDDLDVPFVSVSSPVSLRAPPIASAPLPRNPVILPVVAHPAPHGAVLAVEPDPHEGA